MKDIPESTFTTEAETTAAENRRAYKKPELVEFGQVVANTLGSFAGGGESGSGGNVYCYAQGACDGFGF